MPREVDKRKTARALRKLERVTLQSEKSGAELSTWEKDFIEGVSGRLETYGSAFRDPQKGLLEEPLSQRQTDIVRVLTRKTRPRTKSASADASPPPPKPRKPLRARKPMRSRRPPDGRPQPDKDQDDAED